MQQSTITKFVRIVQKLKAIGVLEIKFE